uniref:Uncharacterized protein n=1 Tax=Siphoviridae sp. ctHip2 TaxID=2827830 RepID=A0A8S5RVC3_9CAUD|nr:MAG TPA: hypothetical protein [Siphoviridae sp. ctHip2]
MGKISQIKFSIHLIHEFGSHILLLLSNLHHFHKCRFYDSHQMQFCSLGLVSSSC